MVPMLVGSNFGADPSRAHTVVSQRVPAQRAVPWLIQYMEKARSLSISKAIECFRIMLKLWITLNLLKLPAWKRKESQSAFELGMKMSPPNRWQN